MPPTPYTALMRCIEKALAADGFRRAREHLERRRGPLIDVIEFRKVSGGTREYTTFGVHYGQLLIPLYEKLENGRHPERVHISECHVFGSYKHSDGAGFAFSVRHTSNIESVCADVVDRIRKHVLDKMTRFSSAADFIAFWRTEYGGIAGPARDRFLAILLESETVSSPTVGTRDANTP